LALRAKYVALDSGLKVIKIAIIFIFLIIVFSATHKSNPINEYLGCVAKTIYKDCPDATKNIIRRELIEYNKEMIKNGMVYSVLPIELCDNKEITYQAGRYAWEGNFIECPQSLINFNLNLSLTSFSPFSINVFPITILAITYFILYFDTIIKKIKILLRIDS